MATVRKDLNRRLARSPEVKKVVRAVAEDILAAAQARANQHRHTGGFADSLHIETGRTDVHVVADDPQAVAKEFGHIDADTGRSVPGIHALSGAVADVASRR